MGVSPVEATPHIAAANRAVAMSLAFDDREDFQDAQRGFVGALSPALVSSTDGRVVWDMEPYRFLDGDCPDTVNPSLWRQAQLLAIHGLFEVAPGVYQVRGLDLSNMTIVEGDAGVLVIDPLISAECAAAALALYREHRGDRPVKGLLYTHSHIDHFGGAKGVVCAEDVRAGRLPVLAPIGFTEHAVSENVYAGTAMARRAGFMYGVGLEPGPGGHVSAGLGMRTSTGTVTFIPPTVDITHTGQEEVVDGIRMRFQLTPGTEAPAEMNFHFPDHGVFCVAENATHNLHNVLTLRGALVRDAHAWSKYLNETIELLGSDVDVLFAQHHWPRWGSDRITDFLSRQRDVYGYLHDQTLRLLNQGHVGAEIAERLELPPTLAGAWHCRGYYGSVSHNVKAIYQRYMGWFDGNPAHLFGHPPEEAARRYVDFMGGPDAVVEKAHEAFAQGDYRWVAEVVSHVVFADAGHTAARELEARALEQLGYGAENATWRNFFLVGARELRAGTVDPPETAVSRDMVANLTVEQLFDTLAIRIDGPRAWGKRIVLNWHFPDSDERYATTLENGVLSYVAGKQADDAHATVTVERSAILEALSTGRDPAQLAAAGKLVVVGEASKLGELLGLLDAPDPSFAIVTP